MKFSEYHLNDALGAILAHSLRLPNKALKKGTILTQADLWFLKEYGYQKIVCAKLEEGDLNEDCLLYTSPSPRDGLLSRMPSSA